MHSTSSYQPITWRDGMGCYWIHVSVISCTHWSILNSERYIFDVLRPVALRFIRAMQNPTFQQDNVCPHVAGIVWTFLHIENVWLLPWPAHSSDLSPIENVWSMVAE
ncbi:uncharacterized protein TNCV_3190511 [Trichonephila clavipes]|nr:uncharacterized protein TNCV_3190511 [Trichonephila clavipes]